MGVLVTLSPYESELGYKSISWIYQNFLHFLFLTCQYSFNWGSFLMGSWMFFQFISKCKVSGRNYPDTLQDGKIYAFNVLYIQTLQIPITRASIFASIKLLCLVWKIIFCFSSSFWLFTIVIVNFLLHYFIYWKLRFRFFFLTLQIN